MLGEKMLGGRKIVRADILRGIIRGLSALGTDRWPVLVLFVIVVKVAVYALDLAGGGRRLFAKKLA